MSTPIANLIYQVRLPLDEPTPVFWTDPEIIFHLNNGAKILWRAIVDQYDHHFVTVDDTHFFLVANQSILYGVQPDVYKVVMIEPLVLGQHSTSRGLIFEPADWTSPKFIQARARGPVHPSSVVLYYTLMKPGAPVGAPDIRVAPQVSANVALSVTYNHTIGPFDETNTNPIPGESDAALIAYAVAQCRAKEREDGLADPGWMSIFATERSDLLTRCAPRQVQQSAVVEGMFEGESEDGGGWGFR